ncbi:DNA-binding transcriptional ArsR family regulator [Nocardia transvalensis]|uniref:DNA-binding transcriptional ArsR family regulator n=1 Tax=Nocardia transvalensis TaxID=37333 RepID=A0A7W9PKP5_9NOCA|nr:helix-turn-helix domain-containing protein [Nocardia transvalensis]MBB5917473.1 DNA-binding transcriptional ArsR family regulator [Nocardia transvalensis]
MGMVIDETHPAAEQLRLSAVLAALSDPARLAAVRALATAGEVACTELQQRAGLTISRSTFSYHQRVLREAGVIQARVRGARRMLSLRRDDLDTHFPGLLNAILDTAAELM